jgi:arginine decarboxylase
VRSLADELAARNIEVVEAATFEDGIAMVVSDASIHGIFVDWGLGQMIQSLTKKAWSS